jgi:hypothetical protein
VSVAAAGAVFVVLVALGAAAVAGLRSSSERSSSRARPSTLSKIVGRPAAVAGLSLAIQGTARQRRRTWSAVGSAAATVALTAAVVALGWSAKALVDQPKRFGYDWDVIALNAFDDQAPAALKTLFADDPDVTAVTGFTSNLYSLDGKLVVSGFAVTEVEGSMHPTLLAGRQVQADDEVALGRDTLAKLGTSIGGQITISEISINGPPSPPARVRIVGIVTFPPVSQTGTDQPRLGTGMLLTAGGRQRLGVAENQPEWTALRLAHDVRPAAFVASHSDGVPTALGRPTEWFTSAAPAELRELKVVLGLVAAAVAISATVLLGVVLYALVTQVRAHRHDFAVLHAIGFTRRQLAAVAGWQSLPLVIGSVVIGTPIGLALGRSQYATFARRLGVVPDASTPPMVLGGLVLGVLLVLGVSVVAATALARRTHSTISPRSE